MDLRKAIQKEHSRTQSDKIIEYVGNNPARFKVLVDVFLTGPHRITQRAAWPLSYCVERNPRLITPHLGHILDHLKKPAIHNAVKRNTVRFLQFIDIPRRYQGKVAATCFQFLEGKEPVAIKAFSMTVLANIAMHNPELKQEIVMIIEDQLPYGSPAFRGRAKKVLQQLKPVDS
jgi:hypothetical protein